MKILIKTKDYTIIDVKAEGTVSPDDPIARAVARAFLSDVESGSYGSFVQPVYKPDGSIDEDKKTILLKEAKGLRIQGVVGILRNKKFNPMTKYSDVIRDYHDRNPLTDQNVDVNGSAFEYDEYNKYFDVTLQIGSRFDSDDSQFFLESMFVDEPLDLIDIENDAPSNEESILDFLMLFLFKQQLQCAYEAGPYRKYVRYEKNDSRLKGSIDIARHIKSNAGLNNGSVAYSYRENTADNNITHLIIHAYDHTLKYFPGYSYSIFFSGDNTVDSIVRDLRTMAPSYEGTNAKTVMSQSNKVIDHPYYYKYEALRKTCIMLLRFDGLSMFDGSDEDIQGILFYIPTLWENFLERQFKKKLEPPYNARMETQDNTTKVYVAPNKKEGSYPARPDFVFYNDWLKKVPLLVMDAKFKPKWASNYGKATLPDPDDFDKCLRDMCAQNTRAVGVIFPNMTNASIKGHMEYRISKHNDVNVFYTLPVVVPDSSTEEYKDHSAWAVQFEKNIESAANELTKMLGVENEERDKRTSLYKKVVDHTIIDDADKKLLASILGIKGV